MSGNDGHEKRVVRAQFGEMLRFAKDGWRPRPGGHRCPTCRGPLWGKRFGRWERFTCASCGNAHEVKTN